MAIFDNVNITPKEKAQLGLPLPDRLSIFEIYDLWWTNKAAAFIAYLEAMCRAYKEGNLIGERVENYQSNPLDSFRVESLLLKKSPLNHGYTTYCFNVLIHKNDFIAWLDSEGAPKPTGCLLENWWKESELHAEAVASAGSDGQGGTDQTFSKVIQSNKNEFEFSGLLNIPGKVDAWFRVIDDMTRKFHIQNTAIPNETQAWASLWTAPPAGYAITTGKDKGEDCLMMPGVRPLGKRSFDERWKKYTATISG